MMLLFIFPSFHFSTLYLETGEINPIKQRQITSQRSETYDKLFVELFGPNGLADRNKNTAIEFGEKVEAYRRMGFTESIFIEWCRSVGLDDSIKGNSFPNPNLGQLKRAVKSYRAENQ